MVPNTLIDALFISKTRILNTITTLLQLTMGVFLSNVSGYLELPLPVTRKAAYRDL